MPTSRRSGRRRSGIFLFLAIVAVVAAVTIAVWRGTGPLPDPPGCTGTVAGRTVDLEPDQAENASLIAALGVKRGLPARAVSIALATAYQESKIRNLTHGDRDSIGICMVGTDRYSVAQWGALANLVSGLRKTYPNARLVGHRDLSPDKNGDGTIEPSEWLKTCPGFNVADWVRGDMEPLAGHILVEAGHAA